MTLKVEATPLPGVFVLRPVPAADERGSFTRLSCATTLAALGIDIAPRQTSLSRSKRRHTLRGLHWQASPGEETKIVHCLGGAIFDVVVDVRPDSPTFRRTFGIELNRPNGLGLLVPAGCAHGLLTLTDNATVLYQIDRDHDPALARRARWNDPAFGIVWPAAPAVISDRDAHWPDFVP